MIVFFEKKLLRILRFAIREQRLLPPIIFQRFICSPFIYSRVHMALRISFVPYLILFWNAQDAASLWNSILWVFLFSYRRINTTTFEIVPWNCYWRIVFFVFRISIQIGSVAAFSLETMWKINGRITGLDEKNFCRIL